VSTPENFEKRRLIGINPLYGRQPTGGCIQTLWKLLLVDESDDTGEEALDKVQDVADRLHDESLCCEDVAVKDHLPLDASLRREERRGMHGELQF